jgi:hypothetical protein
VVKSARSFFLLIAATLVLRRSIDCGQMTTQLGIPRGRYDEHSSKSSLSKKLRFIKPVGKRQTSEGDAC